MTIGIWVTTRRKQCKHGCVFQTLYVLYVDILTDPYHDTNNFHVLCLFPYQWILNVISCSCRALVYRHLFHAAPVPNLALCVRAQSPSACPSFPHLSASEYERGSRIEFLTSLANIVNVSGSEGGKKENQRPLFNRIYCEVSSAILEDAKKKSRRYLFVATLRPVVGERKAMITRNGWLISCTIVPDY